MKTEKKKKQEVLNYWEAMGHETEKKKIKGGIKGRLQRVEKGRLAIEAPNDEKVKIVHS